MHWGARALLSTQRSVHMYRYNARKGVPYSVNKQRMAYNCSPHFPKPMLQCIATLFSTHTVWDCFGPSLLRRVFTYPLAPTFLFMPSKTSSGEFGQGALVQRSFSTKKMAPVVEARVAPLAKNRLGVPPKFRCLLAPARILAGPSVSGAVSQVDGIGTW